MSQNHPTERESVTLGFSLPHACRSPLDGRLKTCLLQVGRGYPGMGGYGCKVVGVLRAAVLLSNHTEGPPGGANLQKKLLTCDSLEPITLILNEKKK